jgi:putative Mg2+ transporter-C (MgtC) family protein
VAAYNPNTKKDINEYDNGSGMSDLIIEEELFMDIAKILIAILCGGIIGFERELKDKPAGLKTNILVSTGSCLFVIIGLKVTEMFKDDPGRIIGPIITGIGFLGAGTIIRARGSVRGLTSAATIWVVAGVGMCAGMGLFHLAILLSLLVVLILFILAKGEVALSEFGIKDSEFTVISKPSKTVLQSTKRLMNELDIYSTELHVIREIDTLKIMFTAHGKHDNFMKLTSELMALPEVKEAIFEVH